MFVDKEKAYRNVGEKRRTIDKHLAFGKERSNLGPFHDKRDDTEVGIRGGVGGFVSGDDDGIGEPHDET